MPEGIVGIPGIAGAIGGGATAGGAAGGGEGGAYGPPWQIGLSGWEMHAVSEGLVGAPS